MGIPQRALKATLFLLIGGLVLVVPALAKPKVVARLEVGRSVFWTSPYIESAEYDGDESKCEAGCFKYRVAIADGGRRLRVALDYPMTDGVGAFKLNLQGPDGRRLEPTHIGSASAEIFVKDAAEGIWSVEVTPLYATKTAFRLRAKLEGRKARAKKRHRYEWVQASCRPGPAGSV